MPGDLGDMGARVKAPNNGWNKTINDFTVGMEVYYLAPEHQKLNSPSFRRYGVVTEIEERGVWVKFNDRIQPELIPAKDLKPC